MANSIQELTESERNKLTPMMQHYIQMKEENPGCVVFYRLGDFYEMFFEDAVRVSAELELTLTGKSCGLEERAPMCGVPFHAADTYINRLVDKGYKVAICEQVEDPKTAVGMVKREVIRIVTPGTNMNMQALEEGKNNYILSVCIKDRIVGISSADLSTGQFMLTDLPDVSALQDEILRFSPSEIICDEASGYGFVSNLIKNFPGQIAVNIRDKRSYDEERAKHTLCNHFRVNTVTGLGIEDFPAGICAAGALLAYLEETQKCAPSNLTHITPYIRDKYMLLDSAARRNLELTETIRDKEKRGSLLWVIDHTKTAMGARLLRSMAVQPLLMKEDIDARLDAVTAFVENPLERDEIREYMTGVYDLERLMGKVGYLSANPRDLQALSQSLKLMRPIADLLKDFSTDLLSEIAKSIDPPEVLCNLIDSAIAEEPPLTIREGGIIRDGFDEQVDSLRKARVEGKSWLAALEEEERQRTGIKNLKIKYNKVFGYYFEVTNSFKDLVPADFIRKQTLAGAERFTTDRLKSMEDTILNAEEKCVALEYEIFCKVRDAAADEMERILSTARAAALLDVLVSHAYTAERNHYVRPVITEEDVISIKNGRHPVVEKVIGREQFIANDTYLDGDKNQISIITGPNMAGKSTYMRQTALITLMAQIGSYVPAEEATIGIVDRIFTRVGASDDLASGQSTFMVEMNEVANILRNATGRSLLILDEIGRGTSTYDGLSIAWAVIEHISNRKLLGAKTLFATHYHELTELEGRMHNVKNYCVAVKEKGDDIVFLRKIIKGGADKSYGIQVARLAGIPDMVIDRAKEIAAQLDANDISRTLQEIVTDYKPSKRKTSAIEKEDVEQMSLFATVDESEILRELEEADVMNMTPVEAMNILYRLQSKLKNRWSST